MFYILQYVLAQAPLQTPHRPHQRGDHGLEQDIQANIMAVMTFENYNNYC